MTFTIWRLDNKKVWYSNKPVIHVTLIHIPPIKQLIFGIHKLSHFFQELAQMEEKFKRMNLFPEIDLGDISQQEREEGQEWRAEI